MKVLHPEVTPGDVVASTPLMAKRLPIFILMAKRLPVFFKSAKAAIPRRDTEREFGIGHSPSLSVLRVFFKRSAGLAAVLCGTIGISALAQSVDNSANSSLNGMYAVRHVLVSGLDSNTSAIGEARSIIGIMKFDGNGNYTFTGQLYDTAGGTVSGGCTNGVGACTQTGQYAVGANGMITIQNPIDNTDYIYGGVSAAGPSAIVGSSTEGLNDDVFIAIPVASSVSNGALNGTYQTGFEDFLQGNASQVRDGYYTLTANGSGSLGSINITGAMANQNNSASATQSLTGVTYTATGGGFTFNFPASSTPLTALVSGTKSMYISSDGNLIIGGSLNGFDVIVGIKAGTGLTNSQYQGTYYTAAIENDTSMLSSGDNNIDSFYGSNLALGQGTTIFHERLVYFNTAAFDLSEDVAGSSFASDGTYFDGIYENLLGSNGLGFLQIGTGTTYSLTIGLQAKQYTGTGVFIDPLKVWNAASYAPITNSVAPGEFVSLFGSGLASTTASATSLPLPTSAGLGGVKVMVNGRPAALSYVSPTQINLLVPYATGLINNESYATFQVINNNVASNEVTVFTNYSAPGVFTLTSNGGSFPPGVGPAAVLHADYSLVTQSNPAVVGETLQVYVTGMGSVTPAVADGAAPSSTTLSTVDDGVAIFVDGQQATVAFAGLAPGFAGLYQINFVVPSGITPSSLVYLDISTNEAYTTEAKLYTK
jgi:uncharacterized protein (TIGR03437 family)